MVLKLVIKYNFVMEIAGGRNHLPGGNQVRLSLW